MPVAAVVAVSVAYLAALFAVAAWGDRRAAAGRSLVANPWVYALSLSVYATSWTYYGSVGRAAETGPGFLPVYLGPTLMAMCWWVVLRKILAISRRDRITTLADFAASRYGRSAGVARVVTLVAVVGVVPYIALQLTAVSTTFDLLVGRSREDGSVLSDSALWVAVVLAAFTVLFGTRHLDATERHEGMVTAIAAESVVKLVALLTVGCWTVFVLFDSPADLFERAAADPRTRELFTIGGTTGYGEWFWVLVVSGLAALLLPRQWQVAVVENVEPSHLRRAVVAFPAYLLLANLFVLPIALAGLLTSPAGDPDTFVLSLPLAAGAEPLTLLVFVGGLSAATGMVVVETIALATMVSNAVVVPALLRRRLDDAHGLSRLVLGVRRVTIVALVLLGWLYVRAAGDGQGLVAIGLVSFAAVAQLAPAVLGGLFWRGATRRGAVAGMLGGFTVWAWTLLLPSLVRDRGLPESFVTEGPWGVAALAPEALLGLDGLDRISHGMLWSTLVNVGLFVGLSITDRPGAAERLQAARFVDVRQESGGTLVRPWRSVATVGALVALLERFVGPERARSYLSDATGTHRQPPDDAPASPEVVDHVERVLAGSVGTVSARLMVASVVEEEPLGVAEVMEILDEASKVRAANARLQELDRMKDDFVSTVSHELRTPLTSIRAFTEILLDDDDIEPEQRRAFLGIVVSETERLSRLVDQVLELSRLESGRGAWDVEPLDLAAVVARAVASCGQAAAARGIDLGTDLPTPAGSPVVTADADRLAQVVVNLVGNATKFAPEGTGHVVARVETDGTTAWLHVDDDGPGVPPEARDSVFDRFHQVEHPRHGRPAGTGLGLAITREIVTRLGGRVTVADAPLGGARFTVALPAEPPPEHAPDIAADIAAGTAPNRKDEP